MSWWRSLTADVACQPLCLWQRFVRYNRRLRGAALSCDLSAPYTLRHGGSAGIYLKDVCGRFASRGGNSTSPIELWSKRFSWRRLNGFRSVTIRSSSLRQAPETSHSLAPGSRAEAPVEELCSVPTPDAAGRRARRTIHPPRAVASGKHWRTVAGSSPCAVGALRSHAVLPRATRSPVERVQTSANAGCV